MSLVQDDEKPHVDDLRTLARIGDVGVIDGNWRECLELAYHMGRIRGALEGAEKAIGFIGSKQ